jgi:HD-GYP domain-containing protein (c-di-GMP phosphodiesterase class II)
VRHHHENWDGTGYPDGLKGADIPLASRLISVVDCFDALTSDRPYRSAMSNAEAFWVLITRRGTLYDPLIVDMFAAQFGFKCAGQLSGASGDLDLDTRD